MSEDDNLKLPDTSFMNQLRQSVPHEQCQQITDEVVVTMEKKKEVFCKGTYHTLQDAKKQLHAILTKVMVDKSGYVIDKSIERTERKLTKLKQLKIRITASQTPSKLVKPSTSKE